MTTQFYTSFSKMVLGMPPNRIRMLKKLASLPGNGQADACLRLAAVYAQGDGVKQDESEMREWFTKVYLVFGITELN